MVQTLFIHIWLFDVNSVCFEHVHFFLYFVFLCFLSIFTWASNCLEVNALLSDVKCQCNVFVFVKRKQYVVVVVVVVVVHLILMPNIRCAMDD